MERRREGLVQKKERKEKRELEISRDAICCDVHARYI